VSEFDAAIDVLLLSRRKEDEARSGHEIKLLHVIGPNFRQ